MGTGVTFHRQCVEVLAGRQETDRYGNTTATDWSSPSATTITGCRLVPVPGAEVLDRVTRRWTLYADVRAPITPASRIRWQGVVYDVTGEVRRWQSPTGRLAHLEADLERVDG